MTDTPRSEKSRTSGFDPIEAQTLSEHLDKRLDKLSEKMDAMLGEMAILSRGRPAGPAGPAGRSNRSSAMSLYSQHSKQSSGRGAWSLPRVNKKNMALRLAERSESASLCPSEASSSKVEKGAAQPNGAMPVSAAAMPRSPRPLSLRGLRAMDLDVALRLHAKEVCQEVAGTDRNMKPFLRLFKQSRSDRIWELLDDPRSSVSAWLLSQILKLMVITSVVLTTLQTSDVRVLDSMAGQILDIFFNATFFLEFLCRFLSTPSKKSYLWDPLNMGDMVSALGLPLIASVGFTFQWSWPGGSGYEQLVGHVLLLFMPLARFLKLLRYFESFRLLVDAFTKSAEALPVLSYITSFMVLVSATLIYILEDRSNIPSMPHCLWLALVTMTTVGYGDYYPKSFGGYLTVSVLTFASVLFLALPVGIIGYEFTKSWQKRGEMFLKLRLRNSLAKWGYGIDDVEILFEYADADEDGQLVLGEFIELIRQLRIGVNVESAAALFHLLDTDHNGLVDRGEFLRQIFPDEYAKHTQKINDETLSKSRRRIGMALERLESFNNPQVPPTDSVTMQLHSPNLTPEPAAFDALMTPPTPRTSRENGWSL